MEVRPGYVATEIGALPAEWSCECLGDAAANTANSIVGGPFGSDLVSADYVSHGVPVIRGQNMAGRIVEGDFVFVSVEKAKKLKANLARRGDLIFTQRGTLGQVSAVAGREYDTYLVSQSQMKVSLDRDRHDPEFVLQYFLSEFGQKQILNSAIQTGVPHTNLGILREYLFPAPPLPEQRAIATALSDVDALLGALDRLIAKKRDLKQAAMQQLLTGQTRLPGFQGQWKVDTFGTRYAEPSRNGISKSAMFQGHGTKIVNMGEMFGFDFISNQEMRRLWLTSGEIASYSLRDGDLLFGRRSVVPAGAGKCTLVLDPNEPLVFESSIIRVRLNRTEADPRFHYYYFASPIGRARMSFIVSGTNVKGIRASELRELNVPLPTLPEQTAIAEVLSNMDAEIAALEQRREKTRALKQGMMQELLTGKTRLVPLL